MENSKTEQNGLLEVRIGCGWMKARWEVGWMDASTLADANANANANANDSV